MKGKYTFKVQGSGRHYPFESVCGKNLALLAEDAAESFYNERGGRYEEWPLRFELFYNMKTLGVFTVDAECEVRFSVRRGEINHDTSIRVVQDRS